MKKTKLIKIIIICMFLVLTVVSLFISTKVEINYDLSNYLDDNYESSVGIEIIENEFGQTGNIQVMVKNISLDEAEEIKTKLEGLDNVKNVNFDKNNEKSYKNKNALYIVIVDGDDYSENALELSKNIKKELTSYDTFYGGTTIEKINLKESITSEMKYILLISIILVFAILLLGSKSWLEPIILLISSFVALAINRGSNIIFGEISYITNSISSVLQLALSIDYSIVLLHAYKRKKLEIANNDEAMHLAIKEVLKPVSASSLTTIFGLLALLFMSFKIGFDIGIVLMKGIVVSAITSLTLLPALIVCLDKLLEKTSKKAFIPKGGIFYRLASKNNIMIVILSLLIVITCSCVQKQNTYLFADTKSSNIAITEEFGNNNSIVVVYKNIDDSDYYENKFIDLIKKTNPSVLSSYTAISNTVNENYNALKITNKLDIKESDAELLLSMYNLYNNDSLIKLSFKEFINYSATLLDDDDVKPFISEEKENIIYQLNEIENLLINEWDHASLSKELQKFNNTDVDFLILQLYGLYFYDKLSSDKIKFLNFLSFIEEQKAITQYFIDNDQFDMLSNLLLSLNEFNEQMNKEITKDEFIMYYYQNYNKILTTEEVEQIYNLYYQKEEVKETIPLLLLLKFLADNNFIDNIEEVNKINNSYYLFNLINNEYNYYEIIDVLETVILICTNQAQEIDIDDDFINQLYIMYFHILKLDNIDKIKGIDFIQFTSNAIDTNKAVSKFSSIDVKNQINDILEINKLYTNNNLYNYKEMYKISKSLKELIKSKELSEALDEFEISGIYIKYLNANFKEKINDVKAIDLLNFVNENKNTNTLLIKKLDSKNLNKIADSNKEMQDALKLLKGDNYSRMLLSINLPLESDDSTKFINDLNDLANDAFGSNSYITGEMASVVDLGKAFEFDNKIIMLVSIISVFLIIMIIFRSLSIPIILVPIIQGAIFITLATQIFSDGIFFMSYIVTTCILMGATIDYGILLSSSYIDKRLTLSKKDALKEAISIAMPTIFTSGLILIICGFVICFVSSQNSISTVGLLIGIGAISSVLMICLVLPSFLYLLDKFILKLTFTKKR